MHGRTRVRLGGTGRVNSAQRTRTLAFGFAAVLFVPGPGLAHEAHSHTAVAGKSNQPAQASIATTGHRRSVASYAVPDVTLTDMQGRAVSLSSRLNADTPIMLNFIFTSCPSVCPVMGIHFSTIYRELGGSQGKLRLVSISIDPEYDSPRRLRSYAERFQAGPGWDFLTGQLEDVESVQRAFRAFRGDKMNHAQLSFLRGPGNGPWVRLDGMVSANILLEEYQRLAGSAVQ